MKSLIPLSKSLLAIAVFSVFAVGCAEEEVEAETAGGGEIEAEVEGANNEFISPGDAILQGAAEPVGEVEGALEGPTTGAAGVVEEGEVEADGV